MFLENNRQIFDILQNCGKKKSMLSRVNAEPGFCPGSGGGVGPGQVNSRTWVHPARLSLLLVSQQRLRRGTSRVSLLFSVSSLQECFLVLRHVFFLSLLKNFLVILVLGAAFSTLWRWYGRSPRDSSTHSALLTVWNGGLMYVDLFFFFFFCFIWVAFR